MRRTGSGVLLRLVLCLLIALVGIGAPPAFAVPDPTAGPARKQPFPVQVTFTALSPTLSQGDDIIAVTATLKNTGDREITSMWVRLQRDKRVDSRASLLAVDNKQPSYSSVFAGDTPLEVTLAPGATTAVQLSVPRAALGINDSGAYPVLLNVQGDVDGQEGRVGQAAFTVARMASPAAPLAVSWVLPLIDRPHMSATPGVFNDDELAEQLRTDGRLERILHAAEKYGVASQLTLFIDPALVDEIVAMSAGYQVLAKDGGVKMGSGKSDAADFLARLKAIAKTIPIAITPYADVDIVALTRAGLGSMVASARELGESIVGDALDIAPITDIAWPADGIITEQALTALRDDAVKTVLLGGASFDQSDYLATSDEVTEDAATALGSVPAVRAVAVDPGLGRLLADGSQYAAGPIAATQRLAAELAIIAEQVPERSRNVVLTPPRDWNPSAALLDQALTLTTTSSWITPVALANIAAGAVTDRGPLQYPPNLSNRELPAAALQELSEPHTQLIELAPAFGDADQQAVVLGPVTKATYAASSSAWRGDPKRVSAGAADINGALAQIRGQIRLVTPSNGSYTLAASDAPLVFTVENKLPVPVYFRIGLDPRRSAGLSPTDIGVQTIPARSRLTVKLPTAVERSGTFSVVAQIRTPDGKPLGQDVAIKVSSSAYGTVALVVTGTALTLLVLLIGRRWWKRRAFRRGQEHEHSEQEHHRHDGEAHADEERDVVGSQPTASDTDVRHRADPHFTEEDPP